MSNGISAEARFKQLAGQIHSRLVTIDGSTLSRQEQAGLAGIRRLCADIRLDIRDMDYADSRRELDALRPAATKRLLVLRTAVLAVSESDVFTAVEVAEISAALDVLVTEISR